MSEKKIISIKSERCLIREIMCQQKSVKRNQYIHIISNKIEYKISYRSLRPQCPLGHHLLGAWPPPPEHFYTFRLVPHPKQTWFHREWDTRHNDPSADSTPHRWRFESRSPFFSCLHLVPLDPTVCVWERCVCVSRKDKKITWVRKRGERERESKWKHTNANGMEKNTAAGRLYE